MAFGAGLADPSGAPVKLHELCSQFEVSVEKLDATDYGFDLRILVKHFVSTVAALVGDYVNGEVPALLHLCQHVLTALAAESDLDPDTDEAERRRCRYRREQAVLNLLVLTCAVVDFHSGTNRRRSVQALKNAVADALRELVPPRD
jgi:hypothetical protein